MQYSAIFKIILRYFMKAQILTLKANPAISRGTGHKSSTVILVPFGQKIQTYYFCSAYRSFLSEEKIV